MATILKADEIVSSVAAEINRLHGEILAAACTTIERAIRIGELLEQVKASLVHGDCLNWLRTNVAFDIRTVQRYMRVFEHRKMLKNDNVSHLSVAYGLLSGPKISEDGELSDEVRDQIEDFLSDPTRANRIRRTHRLVGGGRGPDDCQGKGR